MAERDPLAGLHIDRAEEHGTDSDLVRLAHALNENGKGPEDVQDALGLTDGELALLALDPVYGLRPLQTLPCRVDGWDRWLATGGRGAGKTYLAVQFVYETLRRFPGCSVLLVAKTRRNCLDTLVEGPSGLLKNAPVDFALEHSPSKARLDAPNGSRVFYRAYEQGALALRGLEFHAAVLDEVMAWAGGEDPVTYYREIGELVRGTTPEMVRQNVGARILVSSTPVRGSELFRYILTEPGKVVRCSQMSSLENAAHLDAGTVRGHKANLHGGSWYARQEVLGELSFEAMSETLFSHVGFTESFLPIEDAPTRFDQVIISLDAVRGGTTGRADDTGCAALGFIKGPDEVTRTYVLEDTSANVTDPMKSAQMGVDLWKKWLPFSDLPCKIITESEGGGASVRSMVKMLEPSANVRLVLARQHGTKLQRAAPMASALQAGLVKFVGQPNQFAETIRELKAFTGAENKPDARVDSLAWGVLLYGKIASLSNSNGPKPGEDD